MKRFILILLLVFLTLCTSGALLISQEDIKEIKIEYMPSTVEEFTEMRNEIAVTPEGGASMFVLAMIKYIEDEELGIKFFTMILDKTHLKETTSDINVKGYTPNNIFDEFLRRLRNKPYLPNSYVIGTSPENQYQLPEFPYTLKFNRNPYNVIEEDKKIKVFVACSGADSNRPVTLQKNSNGIWKAFEFSTLSVGIREPEEIDDL